MLWISIACIVGFLSEYLIEGSTNELARRTRTFSNFGLVVLQVAFSHLLTIVYLKVQRLRGRQRGNQDNSAVDTRLLSNMDNLYKWLCVVINPAAFIQLSLAYTSVLITMLYT